MLRCIILCKHRGNDEALFPILSTLCPSAGCRCAAVAEGCLGMATQGTLTSAAADFACAREQAFFSTEDNRSPHLCTSPHQLNLVSPVQAADAQQWLKAACRMATEEPLSIAAADFACAREQAFPSTEENAFRHLRTADFSDTVAALPPEELQVLHLMQYMLSI